MHKINMELRIEKQNSFIFNIEPIKTKLSAEKSFSFIDLFSGIGGFRIALEKVGGQCVGFSEIDNKAIEIYKRNFDTLNEYELGDLTKVKDFPYADILVGGVPCQSWSIAGKMRGFEDSRGKLWLDTINATKDIKPKAFIYENVKGLADPRNKENLDLIISEFNNIGYNTYYEVLNAFDYGLPQSRERLFVVGIRKDIDKNVFSFPDKYKSLPLLASVLEGSIKIKEKVSNQSNYKNSFNMAAIANKGNFYIFSDVRNGDHTIHSWDLIETNSKEKAVCVLMLKNRRKSCYGSQDGNPMSYEDIQKLYKDLPSEKKKETYLSRTDLNGLVDKKILRKVENKYEFVNSKISSGINGIYRIFLPDSYVFSTLTKSGNRDFVAEINIPKEVENKKKYFIKEIYLKKKYRQITIREGARIQGFNDDYIFDTNYSTSMGLLGNAVAVNIVLLVAKNLLKSFGR
jgi:DNA (cytosine-5)-methyltransferase 1